MNIVFKLLLGLLVLCSSTLSAQEPLFRIEQNNKSGYINKRGAVVIRPRFDDGKEFIKGFAVVKENNLYGIIDVSGKYVQKPIFETISEFNKGVAPAVLNGKRVLINLKGKVVYDGYFSYASLFGNCLIVNQVTESGDFVAGVYDIFKKKFIVPPVYRFISDFIKGYALGSTYVENKKGPRQLKSFRISAGGEVTPLNHDIVFEDVENIDDDGILLANAIYGPAAIINYKGEILSVFRKCQPDYERLQSEVYHNGFFRVNFLDKDGNRKQGLANRLGEVVYEEGYLFGITDFNCNRAWIYNDTIHCFLVDEKFVKVSEGPFISAGAFSNNKALANTGSGYGVVDIKGNFIVNPSFNYVEYLKNPDDCFLYKNNENDTLWGLADMKGKKLLEPCISSYDEEGFVNGLFKVVINDKASYIDTKGKIVWKDEPYYGYGIKSLNAQHLIETFHFGFYKLDNMVSGNDVNIHYSKSSLKISPEQKFAQNQLNIVLDDSNTEVINDKYWAQPLYIANNTAKDINFPAIDNWLFIFVEARDDKGAWRAIEQIVRPIDGFTMLVLTPNEYWKVLIPKYTGTFETELRVCVTRFVANSEQKFETVYSNVIKGSINLSQFYDEAGKPANIWWLQKH